MDSLLKEFWLDKIKNKDKMIIINGSVYQDCGYEKDGKYLGFGGRVFLIQKDNGEKIKTNNLWSIGEVPVEFKDQLLDNAKFVKEFFS